MPEYYPQLARLLFEMVVDLSKKTGVKFFMVNLSGGIGVAYRPEDEEPDVIAIGEGVHKAYEEVISTFVLE